MICRVGIPAKTLNADWFVEIRAWGPRRGREKNLILLRHLSQENVNFRFQRNNFRCQNTEIRRLIFPFLFSLQQLGKIVNDIEIHKLNEDGTRRTRTHM